MGTFQRILDGLRKGFAKGSRNCSATVSPTVARPLNGSGFSSFWSGTGLRTRISDLQQDELRYQFLTPAHGSEIFCGIAQKCLLSISMKLKHFLNGYRTVSQRLPNG